MEAQKLKKLYKVGNFIQLGLSLAALGATTAIGYHLIGQPETTINRLFDLATIIVAISAGISTLNSFSSSSLVLNKVRDKMYEYKKTRGLDLFQRYITKEELLDNEQLTLRKNCITFFEEVAGIDFKFNYYEWRDYTLEDKVSFLAKDPTIQKIYQKEYANQDIVGKEFIRVINRDNRFTKDFAMFLSLMELQNNEFTTLDLLYIENNFPSQVANEDLMNYISNREVFTKLGKKIQNIILTQKENKYLSAETRASLLEYYNQNEEVKQNNSKVKEFNEELNQNDDIVLSQNSFKAFSRTKKIMTKVYSEPSNMTKTLENIESLLLLKEKFSTYLEAKPNQYLDIQHFLKEDIDATIEAFSKEANILHKMKLFNHPQLEEHKQLVQTSILERLNLLQSQMSLYKDRIEKDLAYELNHEIEVNKSVLKAKMG